jgi:hypothetical protein
MRRLEHEALAMRPRFAYAATLALVLSVAFAAVASGASEVVLGSARFETPHGEGWGTAQPAKIFNGGDPSGLVTQIHWTHWGGKAAIGHGLNAIFKPHGGYYRQLVHIELRAYDLGRCSSHGPRAYTRLSGREPSRPGGPLGKWFSWSGSKTICRLSLPHLKPPGADRGSGS